MTVGASTGTDEIEGAILFTDLVGFTDYTSAAGDHAALQVVDAQTRIVDMAIRGVGDGRIVKELGDGVMVWCGSAASAVRAASTIRDAVDEERSAGDFPLAIRVGVHYGTVLRRGDDLVGHAVNVAARILATAGPGEVLVSDEVLTACDDEATPIAAESIGAVHVKGVPAPIWLHRT